jgi:UDP-N-acetylmuramate-alanine ligase
MVIEACEYRNAFLKYTPDIAIITNIDPDHLDFFKTEEAYYASFERFIAESRCVVILAEEYSRFQSLLTNKEGVVGPDNLSAHQPINSSTSSTLVLVSDGHFEVVGADFGSLVTGQYAYTLPKLLVPGGHIRLDASLAYVTSQLL